MHDLVTSGLTIKTIFFPVKDAKSQEDMKELLGTREGYILHSEVSQSNLRKYKTMVRVWFVKETTETF